MKIRRQYKIRSLGYFFAIFLSLFPLASFAEPGDHAAGLLVGQVWPAGEIGKDVDSAVSPGLFYEYSASDVFSVYFEGVHSSHSEGNLKLLTTTAGIKAHLLYLDKLAPYVMLGTGLYFVTKKFSPTNEIAHKTNFGVHLGAGLELDLSDRFFMGLELDIHNLFTGYAMLPVKGKTEISGRWTGFFLRGGVRF